MRRRSKPATPRLTSANPWSMCRPARTSEGDDGARPGHQVRLLQMRYEILRPEEARPRVPEVRRGPARGAVRQARRQGRASRTPAPGRAGGSGGGRRRGRSRGRGGRRRGRVGRGLNVELRVREGSGRAFDARALQPVRHLVLAVDEDGVVGARLLALAAAGAVLLDHGDDAEEAGGIAHGNHLERLERAALHALLAAGAALLVDEGDGPLVLLQERLHVAVLVEDGVHRTHRPAGPAADARLDDPVRHALTSSMAALAAAGSL